MTIEQADKRDDKAAKDKKGKQNKDTKRIKGRKK
jgi:hypothetical protein